MTLLLPAQSAQQGALYSLGGRALAGARGVQLLQVAGAVAVLGECVGCEAVVSGHHAAGTAPPLALGTWVRTLLLVAECEEPTTTGA